MTITSIEIGAFSKCQDEQSMQSLVEVSRTRRLDADDIYRLAAVLADSGHHLTWDDGDPTADLASTGGPSSLSTLLTPLYLCSLGLVVPKLGVPGRPAGGIDVLAQLPGYRTNFSVPDLKAIVAKCGFAHFLAGGRFAPLDAEFFRYRQKVGGQRIPALVSASLLAKKMACGLGAVGIDVRVAPHGNFGRTYADARNACKPFLRAATKAGIKMVCILTDARFPYQPFIGRGEALAALKKIFSGQADGILAEHNDLCRLMAHHVARLHGVDSSNLTGGDIEMVFHSHIDAQGSSADAFERKVETVYSAHVHELTAKVDGFFGVDLSGLRKLFQKANSRRQGSADEFPDELGVILYTRPGAYVDRGALLATVRASTADWSAFSDSLEATIRCVEVLEAVPGTNEIIHG